MRHPATLLGVAFAWSCEQPVSDGLPCTRTFFADADGDGHGDAANPITACLAPDGYAVPGDDCNDGDAAVHPGADEFCNDIDDDCDGLPDTREPDPIGGLVYYDDVDGDGYGDSANGTYTCSQPANRVLDASDCDDRNALVHPFADEVCDQLDNDCDGLPDMDDSSIVDAQTYYADADGDGLGREENFIVQCVAPTGYWTTVAGDCDDFDASVGLPLDYYVDADGDGYGSGAALQTCEPTPDLVLMDGDCAAKLSEVNPGASEVCDEIDNDCDGLADDDDDSLVPLVWFADDDGDAYGDPGASENRCVPSSPSVADASDCDDTDASTNPGATEICATEVDEDCDSFVDNCVLSSSSADVFVEGDRRNFAQVLAAPDLDDDGIADLVVPKSGHGAGRVYVAHGPLSAGTTVDDLIELTSDVAYGEFGSDVTGADANGDDADDLFVGAEGLDDAYLFYGPITSDSERTDADAVVDGAEPSEIGSGLAIVRDFDGDGSADLGVASAGVGYVFAGPVSGTLDPDADATYAYTAGHSALDWACETLGDTNGDGVDDIAFATPEDRGIYVVLGGETSGAYAINSIAVASLTGPESQSAFGQAMASADYDGDGTTDLVVGAAFADYETAEYAGGVYAFLGPISGARSASSAHTTWIPDADFFDVLHLGHAVAAGDVDGDSRTDIVMSAAASGTADEGAVFVQLGPATGAVEVRALPAIFGRSSEQLGSGIALVPDWTGDGGAEVALGAPTYRNSLSDEVGALYLFESERFHP